MLALAMAMSRIGAVVGNLTFPLFLESGCFQAFMGLGSIALGKAELVCGAVTFKFLCSCRIVVDFITKYQLQGAGITSVFRANVNKFEMTCTSDAVLYTVTTTTNNEALHSSFRFCNRRCKLVNPKYLPNQF